MTASNIWRIAIHGLFVPVLLTSGQVIADGHYYDYDSRPYAGPAYGYDGGYYEPMPPPPPPPMYDDGYGGGMDLPPECADLYDPYAPIEYIQMRCHNRIIEIERRNASRYGNPFEYEPDRNLAPHRQGYRDGYTGMMRGLGEPTPWDTRPEREEYEPPSRDSGSGYTGSSGVPQFEANPISCNGPMAFMIQGCDKYRMETQKLPEYEIQSAPRPTYDYR